MTELEVKNFEKVQSQLESLHIEISALSKKSQNDALNKFKLKFVNQTISEANEILGNSYKPFNNFHQFDENDLPTNSDVTMILGQYLNCMESLRGDNILRKENFADYKFIGYDWYWKGTKVKTSEPKKIK